MENKDLILFREDLCKRYSQGRKSVSEKETDDLLRCFLEYFSKGALKTKGYAYELPLLGKMYKPFDIEDLENEERDTRMIDFYYLSPGRRDFKYGKKGITELYDKMELQRNQNAK